MTSTLTTATVLGIVLSTLVGCSDHFASGAVARSDAGAGAASPSDTAGGDAAPPPAGRRACDVEWTDQQMGTALDDQIWGMATDENDNVYVSGYERGVTGATNIEPDGDARGVVIRLDPTGAVQWKAVLDTDAADTVEDVAVEPATGRVFAVGRTSGAFDGFVNQGQFDTFVAALDASGATTRILQVGDERPQHPARLSLGASGEVAVVGFDDTYIPTNFVESWEDGFVASFDRGATAQAPLTQRFLQKVPLAPANRMTGVVVDRDGSGTMYVTSYVSSGASVGNYVEKRNADGSLVWSTRISSLWMDAVNAVALSPSNELFVAGGTFQSLGAARFGQEDAFVAKLDKTAGTIEWASQAGSADSDDPTALAFDDLGNIYVAGYTLGSVVPDGASRGGIDIFAMKLDADGALLSTWQTGTANDDFATSMAVDHCGRVFVGGFSKGAVVGASAGGYDMLVVRASL